MQGLFNLINIPLGYVMRMLSQIFVGNFAASVFVFTLLINIVLLPLSIKSQKSSVQQIRLKPKLDELKKRYGDDKQKYSMAMQELYQQEGVSMSGGCLPMIVRLLLMMSIYYLILSPLTYMAGAEKTKVENVSNTISKAITNLKEKDEDLYDEIVAEVGNPASASSELVVINIIREKPELVEDILSDKQYKKIEKDFEYLVKEDAETDIKYDLFGINLTEKPKFDWDFTKFQKIWLIPIFAFLAQILTSLLSMYAQKKTNPEAPSMAGMMLTMPLISLFIGFTLPGGVGFYWICSSIIGGLIQFALQVWYGPYKLLSNERAKELAERCDFEKKQLEKFSSADDAAAE